jgi:hypothetical protein
MHRQGQKIWTSREIKHVCHQAHLNMLGVNLCAAGVDMMSGDEDGDTQGVATRAAPSQACEGLEEQRVVLLSLVLQE